MAESNSKSENVVWHAPSVKKDERATATGVQGCTIWITGLSGSGKSTVGIAAEAALIRRGQAAYVLDGDNLRHGLNGDLGFSDTDRVENIRRVAHVARLFADAGVVCIVTLISPFRGDRTRAREIHQVAGLPFFEVFVNTPLEECERRDPKGLYARARSGEITGFTGIDSPYEAPVEPDLELTPVLQLEEAIKRVLEMVGETGQR